MYISLNGATCGGGLPYDQFVQLAAQAGFPADIFNVGYAKEHGASEIKDLFAKHKLRMGGWGPSDWNSEPAKRAEALAKLPALAKVAQECGVDACATWIMPCADRPFIENWNFNVECLKPVAKVLADHGLRLGLEFVSPFHLRRMFKHEFIFTPGLMLELADAVAPNVGLLVDCFHMHCAGDTWEHLSKIPANRIVLVHLNDAPKVPVAEVKDGERLLPGEGAIDLPGFFAALKTTGYSGPVSLEVFNAGLRAMPPQEAAAKAWQACKKFA